MYLGNPANLCERFIRKATLESEQQDLVRPVKLKSVRLLAGIFLFWDFENGTIVHPLRLSVRLA